jgi:hypothetical protein
VTSIEIEKRELYTKNKKKNFKAVIESVPKELEKLTILIDSMLRFEPEERIKIKEV